MEPIEVIEGKHGLTVKLYQDTEPSNPRKWDTPLGEMVLYNRQYDIGDYGPIGERWNGIINLYTSYPTMQNLAAAVVATNDSVYWPWPDSSETVVWKESLDIRIILPVAFHDYGSDGESLYVGTPIIGAKACRQTIKDMLDDAPNVDITGAVFVTREQIEAEYGKGNVLTRQADVAKRILSDARVYAQYIEGDVYGYVCNDDDSCFDIYGYDDACDLAREALQTAETAYEREAAERQTWNERDVVTTDA